MISFSTSNSWREFVTSTPKPVVTSDSGEAAECEQKSSYSLHVGYRKCYKTTKERCNLKFCREDTFQYQQLWRRYLGTRVQAASHISWLIEVPYWGFQFRDGIHQSIPNFCKGDIVSIQNNYDFRKHITCTVVKRKATWIGFVSSELVGCRIFQRQWLKGINCIK